ncbi:MAG TPA: type II toxin-antitoxin system RelE/ParE family toxin [Spirochaetota bacterium]|nr:type II toxin-antitoxin system RelE/ParE family toxin [Spirochaetota bacterium]
MNISNRVAYIGESFTIEWYYDEKGFSQAFDYYSTLSDLQKRKVLLLFKRIGDYGKINDITKFRYEGDQIFAFKPKPNRFLSFFVKDKKIIITNAFTKKTNKLPKKEKAIAIEKRDIYLERNMKGTYYE